MGKPQRPSEAILGALEGKSVAVWGVGNMRHLHICSIE